MTARSSGTVMSLSGSFSKPSPPCRVEQRPATTAEHVVACGDRRAEPVGFVVELGGVGGQREQRTQEVVGLRVLVEPSRQVGDAGVEVVVGDDGCVHQQLAGRRVDGAGLGGGHPFEHLELDAVEHVAVGAERERPRDVEQVVARQAEP